MIGGTGHRMTAALAVVLAGVMMCACGSGVSLRTGDLLFQQTRSEEMADAIVAATGHDGAVNFTHVGIVERRGDSLYVVEAIGEEVTATPLAAFMERAAERNGRPLVAVGRVREADSTVVVRALQRAHARMGLPYDDDFLPDNGKLYCSELVWECFLAADDSTHLFRSRPMTFRAADGSMPDYWTRHFAALGMAVPEGVAGTNPNDMAEDPAVRIVWRYYD